MDKNSLEAAAVFSKAVDIAQGLPKSGPIQTSYEDKLQLYALFKQATLGDVSTSRPGILDQLGRAKYDAHKKRAGLSTAQAQKQYADTLIKILRRYKDRTVAVDLIRELESLYKAPPTLSSIAPSEESSDEDDYSSSSSVVPTPGPSRPYRTPSGSIILPPSRSIASSSRPQNISAAALKAHQLSLPAKPTPTPSIEPWLSQTPIPVGPTAHEIAVQKTLDAIQISLSGMNDRLARLERRKPWYITLYKRIAWEKVKDWIYMVLFLMLGWKAVGGRGWLGLWMALARRKIGIASQAAV